MGFPYLSNDEIDSAAERLRKDALGCAASAVPVDLDAIAYDYLPEKEGLILCTEEEIPDENGEEVLGKLEVHAGRIYLNARIMSEWGRYRFTLAHEIGHWRLHRPLLRLAAETPSLFDNERKHDTLITLHRSIVGMTPSRQEIQANRFAATLLIPPEALRREVVAAFGGRGIRGLLGSRGALALRERGRLVAGHPLNDGQTLASRFEVSVEAMAIALEGRGYLAPRHPSMFD